jgi:hypothetical protein
MLLAEEAKGPCWWQDRLLHTLNFVLVLYCFAESIGLQVLVRSHRQTVKLLSALIKETPRHG